MCRSRRGGCCAWLLALSPRGAFASGLCVSAAVLTRPNLVPLALVLAAVECGDRAAPAAGDAGSPPARFQDASRSLRSTSIGTAVR